MGEIDNIVSTKHIRRFLAREERYENGQIWQEWQTGIILTMKDGSRWFHSDSGHKPVRLRPDQYPD
jgi:hypothetical protein